MDDSARQCFPHMPDELFDMWIKPEIAFRGCWPFGGDETVVPDLAWSKYLRNLGPHFWRGVRWSRVRQSLVRIPIEERAKKVARLLADVGKKFVETGVAEPTLVRQSPQKVAALADITKSSGQLPKPLVFLVQNNEWWLMDGHHRLGALYMLGKQCPVSVECWLGTHDS